MRGGYGGSKRLIVRHNRSLCDAMRQCKNSRPLRFCENSLTSEGKLPTFPPTEIPAAQICMGAVAELVGNEGGVVSGVFNLESSDVEASDWRPRHDEHYHEA